MSKIVFVGQTPPPYGGQAIMIEKILRKQYKKVKLLHIRMSFSKEMDEIGKFKIYKIFHLAHVILKIYYYRIFKGAKTLYYPPAGPDKIPMYRDIIILVTTRWLFKKIIFHFHAGGISEAKPTSKGLLFLYKKAYYGVDYSILLSELNPPDGKALGAKKEIIIPYGIEDTFEKYSKNKIEKKEVKLLFVAIIKESKGILVLLKACRELRLKGLEFKLEVMGRFESKEFELQVKETIRAFELERTVIFLGVLSGDSKFEVFNHADIFCFPTFFEAETFGVVLLEAMQFSLPIVATTWRGIPSIIKDSHNGFLVNPRDSFQLAEKLEILISNPLLRRQLGEVGRHIFLENYTLVKFQNRMEEIFDECC